MLDSIRHNECAHYIKVEHFFFEELMILMERGKGGKSRYVPILPGLARELRTRLTNRNTGHLFETNRHLPYSTGGPQALAVDRSSG